MHHKRKRPKNSRAGCLMCKPWKMNGFATERKDGERFSDHKRRAWAGEQAKACFKSGTSGFTVGAAQPPPNPHPKR